MGEDTRPCGADIRYLAGKLYPWRAHGTERLAKTSALPHAWRPQTLALDAGLQIDPTTRAIQPNISMSVNNLAVPGEGSFSADGIEDLTALPYLYARWTNPTVRALEERMAALEGAEDALATPRAWRLWRRFS